VGPVFVCPVIFAKRENLALHFVAKNAGFRILRVLHMLHSGTDLTLFSTRVNIGHFSKFRNSFVMCILPTVTNAY
jgi:hypothetical protein